MTDQPLSLGAEFPAPTEEDWRALVRKALKGADFEKRLVTETFDGLKLGPLYTRKDWQDHSSLGFPGQAPFIRGVRPINDASRPWDIRTIHAHPDPAVTNRAILEDLQGGASSIELNIDPTGETGTLIRTVDDLDETLDGVMLDLAPISLMARTRGTAAAALLVALWKKKGIAPEKAQGAFNVNPISTLLAHGKLIRTLDDAMASVAKVAKYVNESYPNVTSISIDARVPNAGGASGPQGVGICLSTGLAYLKALTAAGLSVEEAANQITFTLVTDANFYENIVKVRVARQVWGQLVSECGGDPTKLTTLIHVQNVSRTMTQRDPWVNILRTSIAAFGSALGGADSIAIQPFTDALGQPTAQARRIARNTQIILAEESNLGRVIDPVGGAWAFEAMTDDYARKSWSYFQEIEKADGMLQAIRSGWLHKWINVAKMDRLEKVATRQMPLTGTSEFPNLFEQSVAIEQVDLAAIAAKRPQPTSNVTLRDASFESFVDAAQQGASIDTLLDAFTPGNEEIEPLRPHRLSEGYERWRDQSDNMLKETGERPKIFLATLGTASEFTARAAFAKNFFESGGIEAVLADEKDDLVARFKSSGAKLAVLCSSDAHYETSASQAAIDLKAAGATRLYLAGHPRDHQAALEAAGIDGFIHAGANVLICLQDAYDSLGGTKSG